MVERHRQRLPAILKFLEQRSIAEREHWTSPPSDLRRPNVPRITSAKGSVYATAQRMASALADDDLPASADASVRAATPALRRRGGTTIGTIMLP